MILNYFYCIIFPLLPTKKEDNKLSQAVLDASDYQCQSQNSTEHSGISIASTCRCHEPFPFRNTVFTFKHKGK